MGKRKISKEDYQRRLDRLSELFSDMAAHADELSRFRCPYRDRRDHCTAAIRCRHQQPAADDEAVLLCRHDGRFDYRSAWDSDPRSFDRAKRKLARIKSDSAARRGGREGRQTRD